MWGLVLLGDVWHGSVQFSVTAMPGWLRRLSSWARMGVAFVVVGPDDSLNAALEVSDPGPQG